MAWASPLRVGHGQIIVGRSSPGSSPFLVVDEKEMGLAGVLSDTEASLGHLPLEATFAQLPDRGGDAGTGHSNCR